MFFKFLAAAALLLLLLQHSSFQPSLRAIHPPHLEPSLSSRATRSLLFSLSLSLPSMSGLTLNERFTQQMQAAASRPLASHEQRVHVNLGGARAVNNGREQRIVNGGGQQHQTSSGRTVGLKKAPREVQRQSVKQQSAQPAGASRASRRDGVQQRAQSGRDKAVAQRRAQASAAPAVIHALPLQSAFLAAPVIPQAFQIAPQFLAAPASTLQFNPGQKQTRQQTQTQKKGGKAAANGGKGAAQKGGKQGGKKATTKKGAAAAGGNRQSKPAAAGAAKGRQGKGKAGAAGAAKPEASKDSLDADMDSYMAAAPVTATV